MTLHKVLPISVRIDNPVCVQKGFQGGAMQSHKVERHDFSFYYYR